MADYAVAIFAEGDLEDVFPFDDAKEASAFASGAVQGSSYYGSGCGAYALPAELETMRECEDAGPVEDALVAVRKLGVPLPSEGDE